MWSRPCRSGLSPRGWWCLRTAGTPTSPRAVITPSRCFDTTTNTIAKGVSLAPASKPRGVALTPKRQFLYVADGGSNSVSVYVANELSGNVTVINTRSGAVEATIPSGIGPFNVATSPTDNTAYVADLGPGKLGVIDTSTRQTSSTVTLGPHGTDPFNAAATRHAIYVTNQGANTLSIIDPRTLHIVTTVKTGNSPYGVAVVPRHDR
jgi:YVTN family beta-propeller protein